MDGEFPTCLVSCLMNLRAICSFMDCGGSDAALPARGARGVPEATAVSHSAAVGGAFHRGQFLPGCPAKDLTRYHIRVPVLCCLGNAQAGDRHQRAPR
jgi:hypothetical protein